MAITLHRPSTVKKAEAAIRIDNPDGNRDAFPLRYPTNHIQDLATDSFPRRS